MVARDATPEPVAESDPVTQSVSAKPNGAAGKISIFDTFVTDPVLEDEGVWLQHPVSGKRFRIAKAENTRHVAVLDSLGEIRLRALENADMPADQRRRERARIAAIGLLRDWDESFAEPYSHETATDLLERAPHLTNWIFGRALEYQNFLAEARERDSKN